MAEAALACADCGAQFIHSGSRGRRPSRCKRCTSEYRRASGRYRRARNPLPPKAGADLVLHPCEICSKSFVGRVTTKYCSVTCRGRAKGARPRDAILTTAICHTAHACKRCGKSFFPRSSDRTTYCSRDCSFADKREKAASPEELARRAKARDERARKVFTPIPCATCGKTFTPKTGKHAHCSPECNPGYTPVPEVRQAQCIVCGADCDVAPWGRCLCLTCNEARQQANKLRAREQTRLSGTKAAARKARKLRQRGVTVEYVNPLKVLQRDGWRCQLCGISTPKALRGTYDDRAPEVDHILPISQGGEHSYRNTQCACRKCNIAKGSNPLGQTRLFG